MKDSTRLNVITTVIVVVVCAMLILPAISKVLSRGEDFAPSKLVAGGYNMEESVFVYQMSKIPVENSQFRLYKGQYQLEFRKDLAGDIAELIPVSAVLVAEHTHTPMYEKHEWLITLGRRVFIFDIGVLGLVVLFFIVGCWISYREKRGLRERERQEREGLETAE